VDAELEGLFRENFDRMMSLLKSKLGARQTGFLNNDTKYDTAMDTRLGTYFSAFEAAALYKSRTDDIYVRLVSPIADGVLAIDVLDLFGLCSLLERWFRPYPLFAQFLSFAGERAADYPIGLGAWDSIISFLEPWPEWLAAGTKSSDPRLVHGDLPDQLPL
jgi:hypothetical protein